jgi:hypothetical protein
VLWSFSRLGLTAFIYFSLILSDMRLDSGRWDVLAHRIL